MCQDAGDFKYLRFSERLHFFPLFQRGLYFNTFFPGTLRELMMHKQNWSGGLRSSLSLFGNIYSLKNAMNFKSSFKFKRLKAALISNHCLAKNCRSFF